MIMDITIITLIILVAAWFTFKHFRLAWQKKENPCSDCDGSTCKQTLSQGCHGSEKEKD
jgi:hypothetical protein